MDATLWTLLTLLALATVLALIRSRRRDRCLRDFDGFTVTLAEQGGDLVWGRVCVYPTGIEIEYETPVVAPAGHLERSFIFYRDQFEAMEALYRYAEGLTPEAQRRREAIIARTVNPGLWRRIGRRLRNWVGMVRDALLEGIGLIIGAVRARRPGAAVLSGSPEAQVRALSSEVIGQAGNAFDPLLEAHLFRQVVVEVNRQGRTVSYCGWLKDYTSQFLEIVDAYAQPYDAAPLPLAPYRPGEARLDGLQIRLEGRRLSVHHEGRQMLFVQKIEAGDWQQPMDCVIPPGFTADLLLPPEIDPTQVRVWLCSVERVDMIIPRSHAIVRHAADGSEAYLPALARSVMARLQADRKPESSEITTTQTS